DAPPRNFAAPDDPSLPAPATGESGRQRLWQARNRLLRLQQEQRKTGREALESWLEYAAVGPARPSADFFDTATRRRHRSDRDRSLACTQATGCCRGLQPGVIPRSQKDRLAA